MIILDLLFVMYDVANMLNVQGLGRDQVFTSSLPDGDRGTAQTVAYARQLIAEGLRNPEGRRLAVEFCRMYGAAAHDELAEVHAIYTGVLDNFTFRKHTVGAQLLQPLQGILETRAGDCADLNQILLPSLLGAVGYATRAVTIKADPERPDEFSHVYIEAMLTDGRWIPLDVARPDPAFGKAPEYYWDRNEWPLTPGSGGQLNGYGVGAMRLTPAFRGGGNPPLLKRPRSFPRRGLGDFDWDALGQTLQSVPAVLGGVAQVVKASNTPGIAYSATGYPTYTTNAAGQVVQSGLTATVGGSSGIYVVLALGVLAVFAFSRGK